MVMTARHLVNLRAELVVLGQPVAQPVEALGDLLAVEPGERLGALVDLDPGDDALGVEHLRERGAVDGPLADGLVEEDHAADELAHPVGGEQQLAVGAAILLGRLDLDGLEPLLDRPRALVCREDALARRDQRGRWLRGCLSSSLLPSEVARVVPAQA